MKTKIGILYICTGEYSIFWHNFYESTNQYLLTSYQKHFFVFTDDISIKSNKNVTIIYKQCKGFPLDSLYRYQYFLENKELLLQQDYIFFFNANIQFIQEVGSEILPNIQTHNGLVAVLHAGYVNKNSFFFPFERNINSKAYIPFKINRHYKYYLGGINGGSSTEFLKLAESINNWIISDSKNGIVAVFHDESHFNKYIQDLNIKVLDTNYGLPEGWNGNYKPKILILDKSKINPNFIKQNKKIFPRSFSIIKRFISGIIWIFRS